MDENLARRAHTLLMRAVQLEPAERREFVASSCHGDPELQRRVGQLLQALDGSDDFLETTAWNGSRTRLPDQPLQAEQVIGNYRVVRAIGVGGMATVYEAIQAQPHRRVALKVPRHGWEHTDAIQRFEYETEVLGRLQHPGIAQIYEAGTWDAGNGVSAPFFAMEFVPDALNITDYARTEHLDLRDRLSMFASVCEAVHYGHQKGVIHRDLKPPNILVNAQGQAKVIDFGLARNSDPNASWITQATDVGQLIGTLNYMSPEQSCLGTSLDVRSDVYSLGVVLYQLICNRLPHDLSGIPVPEALRIVQQDPPKRPASVDASLRGDLDAVVLKAIDKDPERRYRSVDALGADIRRFLNRQTVEARPPTVIYQCRMFARRNRALVGSIATVFLAVVLGSILSARYAYRAQMAEAAAIGERDAAIWNAYIANIAAGVSAYEAGEFGRMRATLNAVPDQMKGWEWGLLQRLARTSAATIAAHDDMIMAFDVSSAAGRMVSGSHDGFISVWDAHSHERVSSTKHHRGRVRAVTISHDGQYVVGAYEGNKIVVADAETGGLLYTIPNMRTTEFSVHIDENGILAIIDGDGAIRFIELANNREVGRLPSVPETSRHGLAPGTSSDELLVWGESGVLSVIQRETGAVRISCNHEAPLRVATTSDDGKLIATGGQGIRVWSADDGALLREFGDQSTQARTLDFSPDGKFLASGKSDRLIKFWSLDSDSNEPAVVWHGHEETVSGVRFGGDGANVYSASWDRTIRVWDLDDVDPITTLDGHEDYVIGCAFDPSGSILATSSRDRTIRLWEPATGRIIVSLPGHRDSVYGLAFSHDGRQLASASHDDTVRLWNTETGVCESELEGHRDNVWAVAYDPSRKQLASGGNDQTIRIWALDQRVTLRELKGHDNRVISLAYSPDGKRLASSSRDHSVRLWDPSTGEHLRTFEGHESDVFAVLFSPDGRRLYSGSRDQTVRLWNIETGECEHIFAGHGQFVTSLALSPDGTRLAAGSWFRDIILWDVATRDLVAAFKAHDLAIRSIAFSSDGRKLVSASMDKTARIWDITPRPRRLTERQAARTATAAAETLIAEAVDELTAALDGCDPTPQQIADKIRSDERVTDKLRPWAWKALLRRADELGM